MTHSDGWEWMNDLAAELTEHYKMTAYGDQPLTHEEYLENRGVISGIQKMVTLITEIADDGNDEDE